MSEELETQETEETPEPETQEEEEAKETVLIDDQEVELDLVAKAYKDMQNNDSWQATNTQKAQEIAEKERRLEEDRQQVEQLRHDIELLAQRNYQQPQEKEQLEGDKYFGLKQEDYEELTPFEQTVLKKQYEQEKAWENWQTENEKKEFFNQTQSEHSRLKGLYPDYDPSFAERAVIDGRNQFEDVHLAESFKKLKNGDANAIKSMIPENVMEEIKKEVRTQVLEEARKKEQMKSKLSSVSPDKPGLTKLPAQPAKNYYDVQKNALKRLREQGISLTT